MLFRGSSNNAGTSGGEAASDRNRSHKSPANADHNGLFNLVNAAALCETGGDVDDDELLRRYCDDSDDVEDETGSATGLDTFRRQHSLNAPDGGVFSTSSSYSSSFTSAASTAAQSFHQRMSRMAGDSDAVSGSGRDDYHSPGGSALLVSGQQSSPFDLFSTAAAGTGEGVASSLFYPFEPCEDARLHSPGHGDEESRNSHAAGLGSLQGAVASGDAPTNAYTAVSTAAPTLGDANMAPAMPLAVQGSRGEGESPFTVTGSSDVLRRSQAIPVAPSQQPPPPQPFVFPGVTFHAYPTAEYFANKRLENAFTALSTSAATTAGLSSPGVHSTSPQRHINSAAAEPPQPHAGGDAASQEALDAEENDNAAPSAHHHTGAKIFLGGLRFEVIQAGRHVVSWIFEAACGVHLPPNSILIHRRSKHSAANQHHHSANATGGSNAKGGIAPTGCASVFVAGEADMQQLLAMNQRVFCAPSGIYVADSADRMRQLLAAAQRSILDVVDGKIRGPTHPVVVERANSGGGGHQASGAGHAGGGRHGASANPHGSRGASGRRPPHSTASSPSDGMSGSGLFGSASQRPPPPPYGAVSGSSSTTISATATPRLGPAAGSGLATPTAFPFAPGSAAAVAAGGPTAPALPAHLHPLGMVAPPPPPSPLQSHLLANAAAYGAGGGVIPGGAPVNAAAVAAAMLGLLQQQQQQTFNAAFAAAAAAAATAMGAAGQPTNPFFAMDGRVGLPGETGAAPATTGIAATPSSTLAESHLSFHVYPGDAAVRTAFGLPSGESARASASASASGAGAFLGGLPAEATPEYVSWMLSLMGLRVSPERVQRIGGAGTAGETSPTPRNTPSSEGSSPTSGTGTARAPQVCATAQLTRQEELATLLTFRDRLLPTRRGVWVGRSAATIATLLLEDPSLADATPLYMERRNLGAVSAAPPSLVNGPPPPPPGRAGPPPPPPPPFSQGGFGAPPPPPPPPYSEASRGGRRYGRGGGRGIKGHPPR